MKTNEADFYAQKLNKTCISLCHRLFFYAFGYTDTFGYIPISREKVNEWLNGYGIEMNTILNLKTCICQVTQLE